MSREHNISMVADSDSITGVGQVVRFTLVFINLAIFFKLIFIWELSKPFGTYRPLGDLYCVIQDNVKPLFV